MSHLLSTKDRYGSLNKFLHWLMAVLMILMLGFGLLLEDIPEAYKGIAFGLHKSTGITLLLLVVIRLGIRFVSVQPELPATVPPLMKRAAHAMHWLLYALMLAMPLSGWAMSSAFGKPVVWFGLIAMPELVQQNRELGGYFKQIHDTIGTVLIVLVPLHIGAALYHHFIRKDDILKKMLPGCCTK